MKSTKTIQIPTPCNEKWSEMTATEKGKFCSSCQKEVIDYTSKSSIEISRLLNSSSENTCGRFNANQLNTPIISETSNNLFKNLLKIAASTLLTVSISNKASGSNLYSPSKTYTTVLENNQLINSHQKIKEDSIIKLKGIITDSETNEPLPFANVIIDELQLGTSAGIDGKFELSIPLTLYSDDLMVTISYVGYTSTKQPVNKENLFLQIEMKSASYLMGEICVIKKKKWWKRDKNKSKAHQSSGSH
tara:strand:+ start:250 stop:990 length:741 start_codon:yes stop_codon:yes gene_type:complete